jgi:hypothetical protein
VLSSADPYEWRIATRVAAEAVLGGALLIVPGLDVVSIESGVVGDAGEASVVRVRQDLGDGAILTLVEGASDDDHPSWSIESDGTLESTRVGGRLVTGTASVTTDSLRVLLESLR